VPSALTITGVGVHAIGLPEASLRVIVDPGIPVPVTTLSRLLIGLIVGAAETVAAVVALLTVVWAGAETLPAGSVAVTLTIAPVASGVDRVQENVPSAAAITGALVQTIGLPEPSTSLTVEPGSALPVTTVSVFLTGLTVGADGAVMSAVDEEFEEFEEFEELFELELEEVDVELEETETGIIGVGVVLPAGSMVVAGPVGAGSVGVTRVQVTIPVEVAGDGVQVVPGRVTVSPGVTRVQVTVLLALVIHTGATGGVWSTVTLVGADTLPWGSVAVTVSTVPLAGVVAGIQDHVPLAATTGFGVHTGLPAASTILIVSPGVPVPLIGEPSVGFTLGADGVVVASLETVVEVGVDAVLPGSVAVAVTVEPVGRGVVIVQVKVPLAATIVGVGVQAIGVTTPVTGSLEVRVTVAPGVPVPVTTTSASLIGLIVGVVDWVATAGATGLVAVASLTVVVTGADTLPAGSVAVTLTIEPVGRGEARVQE
jgi:hypothetical protein